MFRSHADRLVLCFTFWRSISSVSISACGKPVQEVVFLRKFFVCAFLNLMRICLRSDRQLGSCQYRDGVLRAGVASRIRPLRAYCRCQSRRRFVHATYSRFRCDGRSDAGRSGCRRHRTRFGKVAESGRRPSGAAS